MISRFFRNWRALRHRVGDTLLMWVLDRLFPGWNQSPLDPPDALVLEAHERWAAPLLADQTVHEWTPPDAFAQATVERALNQPLSLLAAHLGARASRRPRAPHPARWLGLPLLALAALAAWPAWRADLRSADPVLQATLAAPGERSRQADERMVLLPGQIASPDEAWVYAAEAERRGPSSEAGRAIYYEACEPKRRAEPDYEASLVRRAEFAMSEVREVYGRKPPEPEPGPDGAGPLEAGSAPPPPDHSPGVPYREAEPSPPEVLRAAAVAAKELVAQYPDNGYGHALLAFVELQRGNEADALAALHAAARAPRWEMYPWVAAARRTRWYAANGFSPAWAEFHGYTGVLFPGQAKLRGLARGPGHAATERWRAGDRLGWARITLDAVAVAARVRDGSDSLVGALVGVAMTSIALDPEGLVKAGSSASQAEQDRTLLRDAEEPARRLRAMGLNAQADWLTAQAERSYRVRTALRPVLDDEPLYAAVRALGRDGAWTSTARLALLAGLVLLATGLLGWAVNRREGVVPWRGRELLRHGLLAAVLTAPLTGVIVAAIWGYARALADSYSQSDPVNWPSLPLPEVLAALSWTLVLGLPLVLLGTLMLHGALLARRSAVGGARPALRFLRRAWPGVALPFAALLLAAGLAATAPAVRAEQTALVSLRQSFRTEQNRLRQAVEQAAREVPAATWPGG